MYKYNRYREGLDSKKENTIYRETVLISTHVQNTSLHCHLNDDIVVSRCIRVTYCGYIDISDL